MHRERHRVAQAAREHLMLRTGLARPQRRKNAAGGGVNSHTAASGDGPSPAAQGFVSCALVAQASDGAPMLTKRRPAASNTKCFSGWELCLSFVPSASVGLQPGQSLDDRLDARGRIGAERIEAENPIHHADIDAAIDPDREAVRQVEPAEQHLEALAGRSLRIEQQQAALLRIPAAHVGDHEQARVRHLRDGARKDQAIVLAGDEPGAIARPHGDAQLGKRTALLRAERVVLAPGSARAPASPMRCSDQALTKAPHRMLRPAGSIGLAVLRSASVSATM